MKTIGFDAIEAQENRLTRIAYEGMMNIPGIRVLGSSDPDNHHWNPVLRCGWRSPP